ncbi:MAG TPA: polymer-forming cytoskeletal protein [Pyrinomonadaceae bacterium]
MTIESLPSPVDDEFSLTSLAEAAARFFDTRAPFEKWLQTLETPTPAAQVRSDSDCEVLFAGVLRVDSLIKGQIQSAHGTLLLTEPGRVEADVDVRVAIIDGYLQGDLRATEYVILNPTARVYGDIHTPSLSINDGAIFEGNSYFLERRIYSEICKLENNHEVELAMAAGA